MTTERVYDRAIPSRFGTATDYDAASHTMEVKWDDGVGPERVDADHLGHVPPEVEGFLGNISKAFGKKGTP